MSHPPHTAFHAIYQGKKVLVTGNTGFKGSWLTAWLLELGAQVYGLSKDIPTTPSHFKAARLEERSTHYEADIRDFKEVCRILHEVRPDFLFHLAAQPLVRLSYREPLETLTTNVLGTTHLLEALRLVASPCTAVFITSDKCYDNVEWTWGYRETDALGGKDPYSASKGGAELAIKTYAHSFFASKDSPVKVAVGRAGNVIGGADWALDRIVPDCVTAWAQGRIPEIRNPHATRPWQHVLEPLSGYLTLGQALASHPDLNAEPFNFGPNPGQNFTVAQLIEAMKRDWEGTQWKDGSSPDKVYEATLLKLCCDKALHTLRWMPTLDFEETIQLTVEWYRHYYQNPHEDLYPLTQKQIARYTELAAQRRQAWVAAS